MGGEEILIGEQPRRSLAAPFIFFIVVAFQFVSRYLHQLNKVTRPLWWVSAKNYGYGICGSTYKCLILMGVLFTLCFFFQKGSKSATEIQLRAEIKQLLKEASTLSQWVSYYCCYFYYFFKVLDAIIWLWYVQFMPWYVSANRF